MCVHYLFVFKKVFIIVFAFLNVEFIFYFLFVIYDMRPGFMALLWFNNY